jgi:DNA-binding NtrC family response regulator
MEIKILVVDDEQEITEYLEDEIPEYLDNCKIVSFNAGYDALQYAMENDIDLLLTDIAMPDMDGHQLFTRVKELKPNLPVIMMTGFGYDPNHAVVKCKSDGLKDVIFKPFNMIKLIALINKRVG